MWLVYPKLKFVYQIRHRSMGAYKKTKGAKKIPVMHVCAYLRTRTYTIYLMDNYINKSYIKYNKYNIM